MFKVSEHRARKILGQSRAVQRHKVHVASDEQQLVVYNVFCYRVWLVWRQIYYGYILRKENWGGVNHKRVKRLA